MSFREIWFDPAGGQQDVWSCRLCGILIHEPAPEYSGYGVKDKLTRHEERCPDAEQK